MATVFQMSYADELIPMPAGTPMGGYGWGVDGGETYRQSGGTVANELKVRCAIIVDSGGRRIVFVQADVISIPRHVYTDVVGRLVGQGVIPNASSFVLAQSHTHSGPMIGDKPDPYVMLNSKRAVDVARTYTAGFVDQVVRVAVKAHQTPRTGVTLGYAEGFAELGVNRRGLSWRPREVPVLVARRADNFDLFAVLAGHACHPVCVDRNANPDSEYCGYAMIETGKRLGVPVMFFQGAAGDINPAAPDPGRLPIESAALRLTNAIVATVRNAAYFPVNGPINTAIETVPLPYRVNVGDAAQREWLRGEYQKRVDAAGPDGGKWGSGDSATVRHAERMVEELKNPVLGHMPMTIQKIDLGGLTILTMSHEVLSGWHVGTKNQWAAKKPFEPLWVMAYTNHIDCYVPAFDILRDGDAGGQGEAGWRNDRPDDDKGLSGNSTYAVSYSLASPLNAGENAQDPNGVEGRLQPRIRALLNIE
ncbi:hypothetical protein [Lentzea sp. NBRC 102530]|uniref:hypothetical protein n=1 Tax=Lentzea sp. NBRC 102530 TaxID=3032201 RepID=UPI0024A1E6E5|nr:hypothetical protein [Lentzea sp. NBRC 102530]GLY51451.1 hypothetical protein Lesp01_51070 [Lentzea sp. NBRC 102530]